MTQGKLKIAYVVSERQGRSYWNRVGAAFVNSDGSITLKLDAVPVSGEVVIRDYHPRDEAGARSNGNGQSDLHLDEPYAAAG